MKDARAATGSGGHQLAAGVSLRPGRTGRSGLLALGALAAALLTADPASAQPYPRVIILLSQTARGLSAEGQSNTPAVNLNGLVTDYSSDARDLVVPPLKNMIEQVYARQPDMVTSELVSKGPDGKAGLGPSQKDSPYAPGISGDGRYIGFSSFAPNLVADAANGQGQIFVYDRSQNSTELISRGIDGKPGNGLSDFPRLSTDGRYVAFESIATNLVAEDTKGVSEIFLFDRQTKKMQIVSVASDGTLGNGGSITPSISEDGSVVAFASTAANLVAQSTLGFQQAFVHELQSGTTELVSVSSSGATGNEASYYPALSRTGSLVAFKSAASNLVPHDTNDEPDVFVRDRTNGTTQLVSVDSFGNPANGLSGGPGISADGRFVAFPSFASNLVPEDGDGVSDVFVYDRTNGVIARVTVGLDGAQPNNGVSDFPVTISADGRWIGFASAASNLVKNDLNNEPDAFLACNPFDEFSCAPPPPTPTPPGITPCVGDCNGNGMVTVDELILMVNIALELSPLCPSDTSGGCLAGDANCDCQITVDEIIRAIDNALVGCHQYTDCTLDHEQQMCCEAPPTIGTATATPTPPHGGTPTITPTPPHGGTPTATATTSTGGLCVGDCKNTGTVTVDDLVRMVGIDLAEQTICPNDGSNGCLAGDSNCDCQITVDEIIQAVDNALNGCGIFNTCNPTQHEAMCCP